MPESETHKKAVKRWRDQNRLKYNEIQRKHANRYNAKHRPERREYAKMYSHYCYAAKFCEIPPMSLEEFLEQFDGEELEEEVDDPEFNYCIYQVLYKKNEKNQKIDSNELISNSIN
jgi:hypothetical protein